MRRNTTRNLTVHAYAQIGATGLLKCAPLRKKKTLILLGTWRQSGLGLRRRRNTAPTLCAGRVSAACFCKKKRHNYPRCHFNNVSKTSQADRHLLLWGAANHNHHHHHALQAARKPPENLTNIHLTDGGFRRRLPYPKLASITFRLTPKASWKCALARNPHLKKIYWFKAYRVLSMRVEGEGWPNTNTSGTESQ